MLMSVIRVSMMLMMTMMLDDDDCPLLFDDDDDDNDDDDLFACGCYRSKVALAQVFSHVVFTDPPCLPTHHPPCTHS